MMFFQRSKSIFSYDDIHFIGVGGIGLSRLAAYFLAQGKRVSGSDLEKSEIVEELEKTGLQFFLGHSDQNVSEKTQVVIQTVAIPETNPEIQAAIKRKIPIRSHFEVLGEISRQYYTIAVAGTNGKSTTTAILGLIFEAAGLDPTVFLGSKLKSWDGNLRIGKSKYLIVEADELNRQFLLLAPKNVVLTNIEVDHLDYYKDLDDLRSAFIEFLKLVPAQGYIIYNKDDLVCRGVGEPARHANQKSYGRTSSAIKLLEIRTIKQKQYFKVQIGKFYHDFEIQIPGEFNVYNALAAIACASALNLNIEVVKKVLKNYQGIWRRFELVGSVGNTLLVSDYAHHPTSLFEAMKGAKTFYPGKKILLVFQPHQLLRTKLLFENFIESLIAAVPDGLVIAEIFDVAGREDNIKTRISSSDLVEVVSRKIPNVVFAPNLNRTEELVRANLDKYDLVIFMGAGDIYKVAERLAKT